MFPQLQRFRTNSQQLNPSTISLARRAPEVALPGYPGYYQEVDDANPELGQHPESVSDQV
jgi:hypothetical protein